MYKCFNNCFLPSHKLWNMGVIHSILFSNKIEVACKSHLIQEKTNKVTSDIFHLTWDTIQGLKILRAYVLGIKCLWGHIFLKSNVSGTNYLEIKWEAHRFKTKWRFEEKCFFLKSFFFFLFFFFLTTILAKQC
jgi:hypothetical protein